MAREKNYNVKDMVLGSATLNLNYPIYNTLRIDDKTYKDQNNNDINLVWYNSDTFTLDQIGFKGGGNSDYRFMHRDPNRVIQNGFPWGNYLSDTCYYGHRDANTPYDSSGNKEELDVDFFTAEYNCVIPDRSDSNPLKWRNRNGNAIKFTTKVVNGYDNIFYWGLNSNWASSNYIIIKYHNDRIKWKKCYYSTNRSEFIEDSDWYEGSYKTSTIMIDVQAGGGGGGASGGNTEGTWERSFGGGGGGGGAACFLLVNLAHTDYGNGGYIKIEPYASVEHGPTILGFATNYLYSGIGGASNGQWGAQGIPIYITQYNNDGQPTYRLRVNGGAAGLSGSSDDDSSDVNQGGSGGTVSYQIYNKNSASWSDHISESNTSSSFGCLAFVYDKVNGRCNGGNGGRGGFKGSHRNDADDKSATGGSKTYPADIKCNYHAILRASKEFKSSNSAAFGYTAESQAQGGGGGASMLGNAGTRNDDGTSNASGYGYGGTGGSRNGWAETNNTTTDVGITGGPALVIVYF